MKTFKLSILRDEIRAQKGTVSQCIKIVCSLTDNCPQLKKLSPNKTDFLALAGKIYTDQKVGQVVTTKRCSYIKKCSVDLVLRWLVANQDNLKTLLDDVHKKQEEERAEAAAEAKK